MICTCSFPVKHFGKLYLDKTVDATGRLQAVRQGDNPRYRQLIKEFRKITGVPVVLNISFNENEPVARRPEEALACFLRTKMDVLGDQLRLHPRRREADGCCGKVEAAKTVV